MPDTSYTLKQQPSQINRAVTVCVPVKVMMLDILAIVDTGAEVTVMGEKQFLKIPPSERPEIQPAGSALSVAEEGKQMETLGVPNLPVELGENTIDWDVYIAPIGV